MWGIEYRPILSCVNICSIRCTSYSLLLIVYQERSIDSFITHRQQRRDDIFLQVDNSKNSLNTQNRSNKKIYKSMSSENGGTYSGQNPCDSWFDNPKLTLVLLVLPVLYFLIQGPNPKKTIK